ncbi:hypothetical protein DX873_00910 [Flagellimonas nanhaiensis]|uniref:Peptidase S74 domain-containing protein n=1 Tax=Flagellimonas nanhaiensis TaxID=2292706 RepID=A0A371JSJ0_9FLAO|nr:hypothetical protein DX873_00910 [Allomuricauda nanhaiensis]
MLLFIPIISISQTHADASIENDLYVNYNTYSSGSTGDGRGNLILFGDGSNGGGWQSSIKWSGRDGFNSSTSSGTRVNAEIGITNVGTYGKADLVFKTKGSNDNNAPTQKMRIRDNGNISVGSEIYPKSQFVVTSNFGANVSGSTGGNAIFGSNISVVQGGADHNKLITPSSHNGNYGYSGMRSSWGKLYFYTKYGNTTQGEVITDDPRMIIDHSGNIGIGTTNPGTWKLAVKGKIRAEEIKVETGWADYVFDEDYHLPTLEEVEKHIQEKGHLINIPSAEEVEENGIQLGEMNKLLLEKIEELTLYTLQQQKEIDIQKEINQKLENRLLKLENEQKTHE